MKDIDVLGYWWLPATPDDRLPGRLTFDQDRGAKLQLVGSFQLEGENVDFNKTYFEEYIHGSTADGEEATLQHCRGDKVPAAFGESCETSWDARFIYWGCTHTENSPGFTRFEVQMSGLREWAYSHPFRSPEGTPPPSLLDRRSITYYQPVDTTVSLSDVVISIKHHGIAHYSSFESSLEYDVSVSFDLPNCLQIRDFLQTRLRPFQDFLCLATGKAITIREITVQEEDEARFSILYNQNIKKEADTRAEVHQCLFSASRDLLDLHSLLEDWYSIWNRSEPVISIFLSSRYRTVYLEHRFLTAVQCIETYHRATRQNKKELSPDLIAFKNDLLENCPEVFKGWLTSNLERPNEPSLRDRLEELAGESRSVLQSIVSSIDWMVSSLTHNRNYYTHYDRKKRGKALKDSRLFRLTQAAEYLLTFCILRDLGFDADKCAQFIRRDPAYQYLVWLNENGELD